MVRDDYRESEAIPESRREGLRRAFDQMVAEAIPPVLSALVLIHTFLAGAYLLFLPPHQQGPMAGIAAGSALLFLSVRLVLLRWKVPPGFGHLACTAVVAVALANAFSYLYLTGEPRQTTNLLLITVAAGVFFLDWGWFAVVAVLGFSGWFVVARSYLPDPEWVHFGFSLFLANALAATILTVRARGLGRVEQLRLGERVRQIEMESALVQTENARKGEQEARKALESAIAQVRESERRFRGLAAATFEGVVVFREGHVLDANARAAELFGISSPQLLGDPVLNLFDPASMEDFSRFIQGESGGSVELIGRRYDGSTFPTMVSVVEASHRGRPAQVMVLRDITDQKRIEEVLRRSLQEAEANSMAKSSFLANMSHELRTPLNSVIGFANILRKKVGSELPPREADYLARIISNGEHLLALIEDILDLSKIDAERMDLLREPLQLEEIIDEVVRTLDIQARKRGVELVTEIPGNMRPLVADSRRLKQVLFNLIGNALKFTLQGTVRVRVRADDESGRPLYVDVIDTGIGIPGEKIEEIFAPFHQIDSSSTRSFGGTGLGLTISRSLCDLMGFKISATSDEGKGSTFTIDLDPGGSTGRRDGSSPTSADLLFAAEATEQADRFK